jgi:hypothetical protein
VKLQQFNDIFVCLKNKNKIMIKQKVSKETEGKPELYAVLCTVLAFLNLKFNVTQYRWEGSCMKVVGIL